MWVKWTGNEDILQTLRTEEKVEGNGNESESTDGERYMNTVLNKKE